MSKQLQSPVAEISGKFPAYLTGALISFFGFWEAKASSRVVMILGSRWVIYTYTRTQTRSRHVGHLCPHQPQPPTPIPKQKQHTDGIAQAGFVLVGFAAVCVLLAAFQGVRARARAAAAPGANGGPDDSPARAATQALLKP